MQELKIFRQSLKDYFTKPMLILMIYPLLGSAIVLYVLFFNNEKKQKMKILLFLI